MAVPTQNILEIKGDVVGRLEANGALDQIRAQIRASVYQALLGVGGAGPGDVLRSAPVEMVSVVADFLQRLDLDKTREVFLREASEAPLARDELTKGLQNCVAPTDEKAVLEQVVSAAKRNATVVGTRGTTDIRPRAGLQAV